MFRQLVSRNEDLRRLVEAGYAVAFDTNHLIVRDVPYLDSERTLQWGSIVAKLEFIDRERVKQTDHQVFFAGGTPHGLDEQPISNLGGGTAKIALSEASADVVVRRSFSNKPSSGAFSDFFDKIESYVGIISGPATELHGANPLTFRGVESLAPDSVFKFHDTLTSRADITDLAEKFKDEVVAIIGLGGTGAYLFDHLVKTPVREIRAFDLDPYHVHNAFRSPGRLDESELGEPKTAVYKGRYESFRWGISATQKFIDASCAADLQGVTFAFVCVDKGTSRAGIVDLLLKMRVPFIDVGMGLGRKHGPLSGMLRMTYFSADDGQAVRDRGLVELSDAPDDLYGANVQISELNALNACLAVIRYKQLRGFYFEETPNAHLLFDVGDMKIVGDV